ncbi:hypothetical protein ACFFGF_04870 [Asaia lannensis]|nr:hypothetical protein [Asaia lannensis]GBR02080.1 hypothetical protein AA102526_2711 [Asaia lannensis NBRC 102526]
MNETRRIALGNAKPVAAPYSLFGTVSALDLQSIAKRIARKGGK